MPIKTLQQRLTQVGVIRLGRQLVSSKGKPYPAKLETFRFTSPSRPLIERIAELYGGTVTPWASSQGPQWEVISGVKEIPVLVPPQHVDPNFELWGNGFRARHCDGETEQIRNAACLCLREFGENFTKTAPPGKACKPTTRLSLMLADLLSLGTFKVESHGWNAAAELPTLVNELAEAPRPIPGRLEIQVRDDKVFHPDRPADKQIESRSYGVPVLHIDFVTPSQAFSGRIGAAAQAALGGAEERAAIGSAAGSGAEPTVETAKTAEQFKALAKLAKDPATVRTLWDRAKKAGVLDEDLQAHLTGVAQKLGAPVKQTSAPASAPPAAPAEVIDAETEPDGKAVFQEILTLAHGLGWNKPKVEEKFAEHMGFDYRDDKATGWALAEFRDALKNGQVA